MWRQESFQGNLELLHPKHRDRRYHSKTVIIYKLTRGHVLENVSIVYIPDALGQLVNVFWTSRLSSDSVM